MDRDVLGFIFMFLCLSYALSDFHLLSLQISLHKIAKVSHAHRSKGYTNSSHIYQSITAQKLKLAISHKNAGQRCLNFVFVHASLWEFYLEVTVVLGIHCSSLFEVHYVYSWEISQYF